MHMRCAHKYLRPYLWNDKGVPREQSPHSPMTRFDVHGNIVHALTFRRLGLIVCKPCQNIISGNILHESPSMPTDGQHNNLTRLLLHTVVGGVWKIRRSAGSGGVERILVSSTQFVAGSYSVGLVGGHRIYIWPPVMHLDFMCSRSHLNRDMPTVVVPGIDRHLSSGVIPSSSARHSSGQEVDIDTRSAPLPLFPLIPA